MSVSPDQWVSNVQLVEQGVERLGPRLAASVMMWFQGNSIREVAKNLGVSVDTARRLHREALNTLASKGDPQDLDAGGADEPRDRISPTRARFADGRLVSSRGL